MEQILLAYGFLKETVTAIMILYKSMKAMVHSTDSDSNFCYWSLARRYISTIYAYNLPRLYISNVVI